MSSFPTSEQPLLSDGIFEILKKVHPNCGVSAIAMNVIESMTVDSLRRIVESAADQVLLDPSHVRQAMKKVMDETLMISLEEIVLNSVDETFAVGDAVKIENSQELTEAISNSNIKTNLSIISLYEQIQQISTPSTCQISLQALLHLTHILEALDEIMLRSAGQLALDSGVKRLTPRHFHLAIQANESLQKFMMATIADGGPIPSVNLSLVSVSTSTPSLETVSSQES